MQKNSISNNNIFWWYIILLVTFVIWGTQHPPIKILSEKMGPVLFNFLRFTIAGLVLLPFVLRNRPKVEKNDFTKIFFLGCIGIVIFGLLNMVGVKLSTATNNAILLNSWPLFVVLIAPLLLKEKAIDKSLAGTMIGFVGIVLVITNGANISDLLKSQFFMGNLLIILSGLCIAVYSMFSKKYIEKYGGLNVTFYAIVSGSIVLFFLSLLSLEIFSLPKIDGNFLLLLLWIAIPTTALTWVIWFRSVDILGVVKTSSFFLLIPVSGVITSALFLGEEITLYTIVGTLLILFGIFLVQRK